jgi:hypothetical protein
MPLEKKDFVSFRKPLIHRSDHLYHQKNGFLEDVLLILGMGSSHWGLDQENRRAAGKSQNLRCE